MELKQLQYFVVSVDMGSLSRAAETLYTTQSHISKTIKGLEKELGLVLLARSSAGVAVTEDGKKVYEYARKALINAQRIADIKQEGERHKLRLAAMPSGELARLLSLFFDGEEDLSVKYQEGPLEQVMHQVSHHQADLGFLFVSEHQRQAFQNSIRHNRLVFFPLRETRLMLHAGPKNPYYNRERVSWADLKKIQCVQNQEGEISLIRHIGHLKENLVDHKLLKIAATVSSDHAMIQLLRETALGNVSCHLQDIQSVHGLRAIEIEGGGGEVRFGYVQRSNHRPNLYEDRFLDYLKNALPCNQPPLS